MNILFKQWIKLILSLLILSITGISRAAPVIAEQILLANGGDSVAISEEWGFVGDTDECEVAVYKYDYSTNLWGDGAGNAGDKHSTIDEGPCTNAKFRSFGASVSTTKGLLVVGAPEAKDTGGAFHGKIFFYNLISDAWVLNTTAGSPEDPAGTPDLQNDALFGFVVSIRSEGNVALMLIGSPGYDVGGNANVGKVYLYTWNFTDSTLTFRDAVVGENAGDEFGTAVTSNGVEFVASAPKFDGAFTDQGKVYFSNVLNPGTALLTFTFVTGTAGVIDASADNHNLGVSLSLTVDRILYMGGNTGPGAYAAEITNIVTPAATKLENFPGTLGGDVSQSRGLAALGYVGSMVELYSDNTNPASPDVTITKQDPLSEPDYARDISISSSGALLMVNGNTNDRAYSYYITSCYKGGTLKANEWTMIGLQCNTSANIGLIFTPDLGTYDTNWVMYRQNGADYEGHQNAYVKMAATEIMIQGHGYWIIKDADKTWTIPTAIGDAATQTPVEADPRAGFFGRDNVAAVQSTDLQTMLAGLTTPVADIRVMFSNPFPTAMDWSLTLFESPPSPARTLTEVAPFFEGSDNSAYVYKTGEGIHNGYLAIAANTPGMPREIAPGEGFFVRFSEGFKIGFLDLNKPVVFLFAQSK